MQTTGIELTASDVRELSGDDVALVTGGGSNEAVLGAVWGYQSGSANGGGVIDGIVGAVGGFLSGLGSKTA